MYHTLMTSTPAQFDQHQKEPQLTGRLHFRAWSRLKCLGRKVEPKRTLEGMWNRETGKGGKKTTRNFDTTLAFD